jgi:hypothetical protein
VEAADQLGNTLISPFEIVVAPAPVPINPIITSQPVVYWPFGTNYSYQVNAESGYHAVCHASTSARRSRNV